MSSRILAIAAFSAIAAGGACVAIGALPGLGGDNPALAAGAAPVTLSEADRVRLQTEVVAKLQDLIRVDTTNPPGNEALAAEKIAGWLQAEGIEAKLYETAPGRKCVVARLKGNGRREPLLLLNHLDVVPAEAEHWQYPPFGGVLAQGVIWGRGALDMKSLGVMQLVSVLELKRRAVPLDRDVIFAATPDEEAGGEFGAGWLVEHVPDEVRASEVLNEGSMGFLAPNGDKVMGIQTAERGGLWAKVKARGKPGHGSLDRPDGATRRLLRGLARLETSPRMWEVVPEAARMFKAIAPSYGGINGMVLGMMDFPGVAGLVGPILARSEPGAGALVGWSINTTVVHAGTKVNVMPSEAVAEIDIRMLPGHSTQAALAYLRKYLDDPGLEVTVLHAKEPSRSSADGPLFEALEFASKEEYPGITVTEVLTPGGSTDSSYFRLLGARAYGLMPVVAGRAQLDGFHGHNEFITVDQLAAGTRVVLRAIERAATTR